MTTVLTNFKKFMADENYWDMTIKGRAGTGKTTKLRELIEYCQQKEIPYIACAYTHTACNILRSKLPSNANVSTLHCFLKKRPGLNTNATKSKHVQINTQMGAPDRPIVMFVDEYSMVGEKDGVDIRAEQDPDYEGKPALKVVYIGDKDQLDAVKDLPFDPEPSPYDVTLTVIYRQASDSLLHEPLDALVSMLDGAPAKPLIANKDFIRGTDIVAGYRDVNSAGINSVILAYTNQRVEELNREVECHDLPYEDCALFSPTTKQYYTFKGWVDNPDCIDTPFNGVLHLESKYLTLEYLIKSKICRFAALQQEAEDYITVAAIIFGHYQYKLMDDQLKNAAVQSNNNIEKAHRGYKAAAWSKNNSTDKLARERAKAWRNLLSFNDCVICLDFTHALTVHKSQGSTYNTVFLDTEDIYKASKSGLTNYLKLMYVGISRASNKVYTN
ncbi:hypothetical protein [Dickeya phage Amaethon]|nr:hypothetical protein [Dickeya phage Amaethon]